jgi:transmembrane protein
MQDLLMDLLASPVALMVGRTVLTSFFWGAGILGLVNFPATVEAMKGAKLPSPAFFAVATIACQLIGSAVVITNMAHLGWLGAGALALFTILTIPLDHAFWTF